MSIEIVKGKIGEKVVYFAEVDLPRSINGQGYDIKDALWELYEQAGDELNALRVEIIKAMMRGAPNDTGGQVSRKSE